MYGDGTYSLFGAGITPKDIFQGSIGNCWLMSAISAIAEKPERIENMFLNTSNTIEPKGVYGVNMYALGVPTTIVVDDFLPMSESDGNYSTPFAPVSDDKGVWGTILEKAFAKFYGNYFHIEAGSPTLAVRTLLGGPWEEYMHMDWWGNTVTEVEDLWALLKTHDLNNEII